MFGGLGFLVLLLAVMAAFVVVLLVVPRRRALVAVDEVAFPGLARLRRSTLLARVLAFIAGLALVVPVASGLSLGRGVMLVPAAFAAVQVLGVLVGDLAARDAARTAGVAGLDVRRVRDFLPRRLVRYTAVAGMALIALVMWASAAASPDDLGRAGRAFRYGCTEYCTAGDRSGAFGPWPGSFYAVPLGIALLGLVLLAGIALLFIVRRPRNGADPEIVRFDDVIRRRSVESVVAGVGIAVAGSLAGLGLISGPRLAAQQGLSAGLQVTGWVITVAAAASVVLAVWCVVVLLLPGAGNGSRRGEAPQDVPDETAEKVRGNDSAVPEYPGVD